MESYMPITYVCHYMELLHNNTVTVEPLLKDALNLKG